MLAHAQIVYGQIPSLCFFSVFQLTHSSSGEQQTLKTSVGAFLFRPHPILQVHLYFLTEKKNREPFPVL